jgi:hypothetical protein
MQYLWCSVCALLRERREGLNLDPALRIGRVYVRKLTSLFTLFRRPLLLHSLCSLHILGVDVRMLILASPPTTTTTTHTLSSRSSLQSLPLSLSLSLPRPS